MISKTYCGARSCIKNILTKKLNYAGRRPRYQLKKNIVFVSKAAEQLFFISCRNLDRRMMKLSGRSLVELIEEVQRFREQRLRIQSIEVD